jgi:hypothetical protein
MVPYEGGCVPQWAKPDAACLLNQLAVWPNDQEWTAREFVKTEQWRKKFTTECGEDAPVFYQVIEGNYELLNDLPYYIVP